MIYCPFCPQYRGAKRGLLRLSVEAGKTGRILTCEGREPQLFLAYDPQQTSPKEKNLVTVVGAGKAFLTTLHSELGAS